MKSLTAIIVGSAWVAQDRQQQLDPKRERFMVLYPEQRVSGMRFDAVIVTDGFFHSLSGSSNSKRESALRWLREDVSMRRALPNAPVVEL